MRKTIIILLIVSLSIGWISDSKADLLGTEQVKLLESAIEEATREILRDQESLDTIDSFFDDAIIREQFEKTDREILRDQESLNTIDDERFIQPESIIYDLEREEINPELWSEEVMEENIREWERASRDYENLLSDELRDIVQDNAFENLEKKMEELLREISMSEIDFQKITSFGDPRKEGLILDDIFKITEISVEEAFIRDDGRESVGKIIMRGTGPPESIVLLFIYSTPIVVNTKTDSEGYWTYVLEKELEDGRHEVYVASADNTGKILAKSNPTPFIKEAAAIQVDFLPLPGGEFSVLGFFDGKILTVLIIIFILIIVTTIILAGITIGKRNDSQDV